MVFLLLAVLGPWLYVLTTLALFSLGIWAADEAERTFEREDDGRIVISAKSYTAKWNNAARQPKVSLTVPDGRVHLVVYGDAETITDDPQRAELTADVFAVLSGSDRPDPASIVTMLDEQQRTVLRITPTKIIFHE